MARMPGTVWQGEHGSSPMAYYDIVCVHTIVGYAPAHAAHFSVKADGTILQSRDTKYKSAANLEGNHRVIAIENEDHGTAFGDWDTNDGHAVPALTDAQVEANGKILRWAHETHGVPLQLCPDSLPGSRGLAYHRQGIDGNFGSYDYPGRVPGGEVWTSSPGKVCPGDPKISQLPDILAAATGQQEWDEMASKEEVQQALLDALDSQTGRDILISTGASGTNKAHYDHNTRTDQRLNQVPVDVVGLLLEELNDPSSALSEAIVSRTASGTNRAHYEDGSRTDERLDKVVEDVVRNLGGPDPEAATGR